MTNYSPPPTPPDYVSQMYPAGPPRPTVVTVLSIIGIVAAILWLLCGGYNLVLVVASIVVGHNVLMAVTPNVAPMPNLPMSTMIAGSAIAMILLILSIVLLAASIAALSLRPWARRVLMMWSVMAIVFFIIQFIVQAVWIGPQSMELAQRYQPPNPAFNIARPLMLCGGAFLLLLYCALPICFLTLWRTEVVIAAFESGSGTSTR